jgi:hypothetical protein
VFRAAHVQRALLVFWHGPLAALGVGITVAYAAVATVLWAITAPGVLCSDNQYIAYK